MLLLLLQDPKESLGSAKIFPTFPEQLAVPSSMSSGPDFNQHAEHFMVKISRMEKCIKFISVTPAYTLGSQGADLGPQTPRGSESVILPSSWLTAGAHEGSLLLKEPGQGKSCCARGF